MRHTTSSADRCWLLMPSGRRLDLLSESPQEMALHIEDEDVAVLLAGTPRWCGCWNRRRWRRPIGVAQHSLIVTELRRRDARTGLCPFAELHARLHDAGELIFDPPLPAKRRLGQGTIDLINLLQRAVEIRFGVRPIGPHDKALEKKADLVSAASEAVHVIGWTMEELRRDLRITTRPLSEDDDPLVAIYGGLAWEPWDPETAAERFLEGLRDNLRRCRLAAGQNG